MSDSDAIRSIDYGERGRVAVFPDPESLAAAAAATAVALGEQAVRERAPFSSPFLAAVRLGEWARFWRNRQPPTSRSGWQRRSSGVMSDGFLLITPRTTPVWPTTDFSMILLSRLTRSSRCRPISITPNAQPRIQPCHRETVPGDALPRFDLVFLGMGDDGHTASLFPFTEALAERHSLVVPNPVPKLESTRLTMTVPLLNAGSGCCVPGRRRTQGRGFGAGPGRSRQH